MTIALLITLATVVWAAPTIEFRNADVSFPDDHTVRITASAAGEGVDVQSYGLRTLTKGGVNLPGLRQRGDFAFLALAADDDPDWYLLLDNRRGDLDPADGSVTAEMDISNWPDGDYRFMFFACNRPGEGAYIQDTRILRVVVRDGKVVQPDTGFLENLKLRITDFSIEPATVKSGEPVVVRVGIETKGVDDVWFVLTVPYTVGPEECPPGFEWVSAEKLAYLVPGEPHAIKDNGPLDEDSETGSWAVRIPTDGWLPGVWNLTAVVAAAFAPRDLKDYRDFAVTVSPDQPKFACSLEHDQFLRSGTHFDTFCRLTDGTVLAYDRVTHDGGVTWEHEPGRASPPMATQLRDGRIIGLAARTAPIEGRDGWFRGALFVSEDGGRTQVQSACDVHVPNATSGIGHSFAPGPIFWGQPVEMPEGHLLMTMYGWFKGDESPVPGQPGSFRYRTWLMRSDDTGRTWEIVTTVGYDPAIGTEGYCEPVMRLLPNGELLCLLRTGGNNRGYHQDNPLCVSRSTDGGLTWSEPERTGFEGVDPDLCVMSDGTLVCSTGRPGAWLLFSTDNGHTWSDAVSIDAERYSGYTAVCEVEPGVLLVGYGAMDRLNPETGKRENHLRTVRVRVERLAGAPRN